MNSFFSFSYGSFVNVILGIISVPIITRLIDPVGFGKASYYLILLNFITMFVLLGTDQVFTRFYYDLFGLITTIFISEMGFVLILIIMTKSNYLFKWMLSSYSFLLLLFLLIILRDSSLIL